MGDDRLVRRDFVRRGAAATLAASAGMATPAFPAGVAASPPANRGADAGKMPCGIIGGVKISRLILGSNPLGGGAHSRDLIYVSRLLKEYNTEERILKTLEAAESQGINTVLQGHTKLIQKYNAERGGRLQQIRPLRLPHDEDIDREKIKVSIDRLMREKAAALYVFGDSGDYLARHGRIDRIATALDVAKSMGAVLGVGGHSLQVVAECEKQGLKPAFYVKTFHHDQYWSATPRERREPYCWYDGKGGNSYSGKTGDHNRFHDNIWCLDPEETIRVMRKVNVPWIAFKVLAAGAIHPKEGFDYAFRNGADFVAVGMLDYQVRENAEIARSCVTGLPTRQRLWHAAASPA